jgi:hypothetical protein
MPNVLLLFLLFAAVAIVIAVISHKQTVRRALEVEAWATRQGLRYRPGKDPSIEGRFPLFSCLREGDDRYGTNVCVGGRRGREVAAFDYHYETSSTDSKGHRQTTDHWFSMVVVNSGLPLKGLRIRPETFFDKIGEFFGFDDIDFELTAFSNAFHVKARDRRFAFDVLHQATMEFLLGAPRFQIELAGPWLAVWRTSRLKPEEFSDALGVAEGILERLPEYLLRDLKGGAS